MKDNLCDGISLNKVFTYLLPIILKVKYKEGSGVTL